MTGAFWSRQTVWLLASAAARLRGRRADWADAMLAEAEACTSDFDQLGWAWGCWVASLRTSFSFGGALYGLALAVGLAAMTEYEWSADESRATIAMLGAIALALGILRPGKALLSGALVGVVVAGVIAFEALSGIRPGYETQAQTLERSLFWLTLLVPSVSSSAMGAWIGRRLRPAASWP